MKNSLDASGEVTDAIWPKPLGSFGGCDRTHFGLVEVRAQDTPLSVISAICIHSVGRFES